MRAIPCTRTSTASPPRSSPTCPRCPAASGGGALLALDEADDFLPWADVFSAGVISCWISCKRTHEVGEVRMRPHPYALEMDFDV